MRDWLAHWGYICSHAHTDKWSTHQLDGNSKIPGICTGTELFPELRKLHLCHKSSNEWQNRDSIVMQIGVCGFLDEFGPCPWTKDELAPHLSLGSKISPRSWLVRWIWTALVDFMMNLNEFLPIRYVAAFVDVEINLDRAYVSQLKFDRLCGFWDAFGPGLCFRCKI